MPLRIQAIALRTNVLGAYATHKTNLIMPLFLLLFDLFFKASKAEVARSNTEYLRSQTCWAGQNCKVCVRYKTQTMSRVAYKCFKFKIERQSPQFQSLDQSEVGRSE